MSPPWDKTIHHDGMEIIANIFQMCEEEDRTTVCTGKSSNRKGSLCQPF